MSFEEFSTAIRLRLGLPHPLLVGLPTSCPCGKPCDATGVHLLRCSLGGETIVVHDAVRDATAQILSGSLVHIRREVVLDLPGPPPQRVRVDLTMVRDGHRTLADLVVANPLRHDLIDIASTTAGAAASRAATTKEAKYTARAPSDTFLPLAIEMFGRLHHPFDGLLRQAARDIHGRMGPTGPPLSILTTHFCQRISVALQRAQARAIYRRSLTVGASAPSQRLAPLEDIPISLADLVTTLDVDH